MCHSPLQVVSSSRKATAAATPVLQRWPEEELCLDSAGMNYCIPKEAVRVNSGKPVDAFVLGEYQAWISLLFYQVSTMLFTARIKFNYSWSGIILFFLKMLILSETNFLSKHLSKIFL